VQALANPSYLNFLAQRGVFRDASFVNYLNYLLYWKEPEYIKFLVFPQCIALLEMLQQQQFLKEIVNAQCSKYIDEQMLLLWLHYKRRREWRQIDFTELDSNVERLLDSERRREAPKEPAAAAPAEPQGLFKPNTLLFHEKY